MDNINEWITNIAHSIDTKDAVKFASYIQSDGSFKFGNQPAVEGNDNIIQYVAAFFNMIDSSKHETIAVHESNNNKTIIWQGSVAYTRLDKNVVTIEFCNVFNMDNDKKLIKDYLIYIDNTPLFAP